MPTAALKPCSYPGCRNLSPGPRCPLHPYQRRPDRRPSAHRRGYDGDWLKLRAWFLRHHPICQIRVKCSGEPATEVDHIRPIADGGDRLNPDNLQSACTACHSWKTGHLDRPARRST